MLTICLIVIFHFSLPANARVHHSHRELVGNDPDLIGQTCKNAEKNEANCTKILRGIPDVVRAKNYFDFSKAILEFSLKEGTAGQNFLKELATKNNASAIVDCANVHYNEVVGSFWSALGELKEDPETANYDAKVAGDGAVNCQDVLNAAHIVNPDINALNYKMSLLSLIAFLATNNLSS
uniref:Uncharacterized protein n=2 Tax=Cajanus cajan TaxID=3821 RepID=A0A151TC78_CAJCA|nr:hypothetical protein KK1_019249 [Cajanus cajan]